jgi:hypothetical protein
MTEDKQKSSYGAELIDILIEIQNANIKAAMYRQSIIIHGCLIVLLCNQFQPLPELYFMPISFRK